MNVDDLGGVNELTNWTVELCGNDTQMWSDDRDFYSSSSRAVLELHTSHRRRRQHRQQQQQQSQRLRPQFRGFRGIFRFLRKGYHAPLLRYDTIHTQLYFTTNVVAEKTYIIKHKLHKLNKWSLN